MHCPFCRTEVPADAAVCPKCKRPLPTSLNNPSDNEDPQATTSFTPIETATDRDSYMAKHAPQRQTVTVDMTQQEGYAAPSVRVMRVPVNRPTEVFDENKMTQVMPPIQDMMAYGPQPGRTSKKMIISLVVIVSVVLAVLVWLLIWLSEPASMPFVD